MAKFLPNEILTPIVGHLRDRRIDLFDPVATKDLQSVRLVSSTMLAIATPMLFENMVYDLKFYRPQDVDRLADFARSNPELAKFVNRLKVKIPPILGPVVRPMASMSPENEARSQLRAHSMIRSMQRWNSWTQAQATKVHEALVHEWRVWSCRQVSEWQEHTSALHNIAMVLPNLRYLENGLSTYYQQKLAHIENKFFTDNGISLQMHHETLGYSEPLAFLHGFRAVLKNVAEFVTSLKMRDVPWHKIIEIAMIPENIQRLDLEIRILEPRGGVSPPHLTQAVVEPEQAKRNAVERAALWRHSLRRLRQLETLRLGFHYGGGRATEYETGKVHYPVHIDDLLIAPKDVNRDCFFPKLKSLELFDCALRMPGLLSVAENHQKTLKELILSRVTFAPKDSARCWREIGDMCKNALPRLRYLRLVKLVTCRPKRFNNYRNGYNRGVEMEPTPTTWRSGLEDAMSYEWVKGDANSAGQEYVGDLCPWSGDDEGSDSALPY